MLDECHCSCFILVDLNPSKCGAYKHKGLITIAVVELITEKAGRDHGLGLSWLSDGLIISKDFQTR
jgi:hypothetical protein